MIPSPLGLHFSSIGVLKLSISALLAWAKIAVRARFFVFLFVCLFVCFVFHTPLNLLANGA
jgi:hypothetical protein